MYKGKNTLTSISQKKDFIAVIKSESQKLINCLGYETSS